MESLEESPYKVLGVEQDASQEEIVEAYRLLAKKHHPDQGGTTQEFRRIQKAYERIRSPTVSTIAESWATEQTERTEPQPQSQEKNTADDPSTERKWDREFLPPYIDELYQFGQVLVYSYFLLMVIGNIRPRFLGDFLFTLRRYWYIQLIIMVPTILFVFSVSLTIYFRNKDEF